MDDIFEKLDLIKSPVEVVRKLFSEDFFEKLEDKEALFRDVNASVALPSQKKILTNLIRSVVETDSLKSLVVLATVLLRFDEPKVGKFLLEFVCSRQQSDMAKTPDALANSHKKLFDKVKEVILFRKIELSDVKCFVSDFLGFRNEVETCVSYSDVFAIIHAYSSLLNIAILEEMLKRFELEQEAVDLCHNHRALVKKYSDNTTLQEVSCCSFMPHCDRHFLRAEAIEFVVDWKDDKSLGEALALIEKSCPPELSSCLLFHSMLKKTYSITLVCFAPCNLHPYLDCIREKGAEFLQKHPCVLSVGVGGQVAIQRNLEEEAMKTKNEAMKAEIRILRKTIDDQKENTERRGTSEGELEQKKNKGMLLELEKLRSENKDLHQKLATRDKQKITDQEGSNHGFFKRLFKRAKSESHKEVHESVKTDHSDFVEEEEIQEMRQEMRDYSQVSMHKEPSNVPKHMKSVDKSVVVADSSAAVRQDFSGHTVIDTTSDYARCPASEKNMDVTCCPVFNEKK